MIESIPLSEGVRVELFLRMHAPGEVVEQLREFATRARRLERAGAVDDVEIGTWATVRPAVEELSDSGPSVALTVRTFQAWADREGYTLRPGFERRETESMIGRPASEIRVPVACVAVYQDDVLRFVAPCGDGERTYTVEECLDTLETAADSSREPGGPSPDRHSVTDSTVTEE